MSGLLAFVVQLTILRKGKRECAAAEVFLRTISSAIILLAAMMADAATETHCLIRIFDREDVSLAEMCSAINNFLDRVTWLFYDRGCLHVNGHVALVLQWLRSPHIVLVDGVGQTIGGTEVSETTIEQCCSHLRAWVVLAKTTCSAEFPHFGLVMSFGVFELPQKLEGASFLLSDVDKSKLKRLSQAFGKPGLETQFKDHWHYAVRHHATSSSAPKSHWKSWAAACKSTSELRGYLHSSDDLKYVVKRGMCFTPSTSGNEQSFGVVDAVLMEQRLAASASFENHSVSLLVSHFTDEQLNYIAQKARAIYAEVFRGTTRMHVQRRADKGIPNRSRSSIKHGDSMAQSPKLLV